MELNKHSQEATIHRIERHCGKILISNIEVQFNFLRGHEMYKFI
jgi:hypothetical protein